jgi:hypothetical protein
VDLFQFNDDFIAASAMGHNDDDVTELFLDSIRAAADVLERSLIRTAGPEIAAQARFVDGAFEVPLTQEQFDAEFGDGDDIPRANVRRAIISSTVQANLAMAKVFNDR